MQDISGSAAIAADHEATAHDLSGAHRADVVSTHVLVPDTQAEKLRELSRKTRVAQSEYLREAVDDLLVKYGKRPDGDR